ncbi:MAG: hypothetical protein IJL41_00715 [Clostridia bacterium]|nr:hypothetical protein [Clostridia bacterium]
MKRIISSVAFLLIMMLYACNSQNSTSEPSEYYSASESSAESSAPAEEYSSRSEESAETPDKSDEERIPYTAHDLGVPLGARYSNNDSSIIPWDIALYKNKLYVGSGDLSANSGPVEMWCYDDVYGEWQMGGRLPEEEISRFYFYNGALYCPGADSQESWDFASFYYNDGDSWTKMRSIPNASHCFDLAFADGKIFAAIENEAETQYLYIAVSDNGGVSFSIVPLMRGGARVKRTAFIQNVFSIENSVYALDSQNNVYKYDGSKFEYVCSWQGKVVLHGYRRYALQSKVEYNGCLYFTTGTLYRCTSAEEPQKIEMPNNELVQDIYINGSELNILCLSYNGSAYVMTVYKYAIDEDSTVEKILAFEYETTAVSFAAEGKTFFFGIASQNRNDKNNGRIIKVEIND